MIQIDAIEILKDIQREDLDETDFLGKCAIDMAIEALKEDRPQWIPCSEKLPEPHKFVLICGEEGDIEVAQGYISTEIEEFVWLKSSWRFGEVVAWMPLPEPYKREGDRNDNL